MRWNGTAGKARVAPRRQNVAWHAHLPRRLWLAAPASGSLRGATDAIEVSRRGFRATRAPHARPLAWTRPWNRWKFLSELAFGLSTNRAL